MKYRIVECFKKDGRNEWQTTDFDNIEAEMARRGAAIQRTTSQTGPLREELRGLPVFNGFAGPSWGGIEEGEVIVRYENWEAYNVLST